MILQEVDQDLRNIHRIFSNNRRTLRDDRFRFIQQWPQISHHLICHSSP